MTTLHSLTSAALREAADIQEKIEALGKRFMAIVGGSTSEPKAAKAGRRRMSPATIARMRAAQQARWANKGTQSSPTPVKKGRKTMSPAARAKIAAAATARWARIKGTTAKPAAKPPKKSGLSPEGRAKLAAAMKARWAEKRNAAGRKRIASAGEPEFQII